MKINTKRIKIILKISWRNVIRNKRRTTLTTICITLGTIGCILFGGYTEANYEGLRETTIHSRLGHFQITKKGYYDKGSLDPHKYSITNYDEIKEKLKKIPEITMVTRRIQYVGLLANDQNTINFMATGVDPEVDSKINTFVTYVKGQPVKKSKPYSIAVGYGIAKKLDLKVGNSITLLSSYAQNGINAYDFTVRGIFESGIRDYDDIMVTVPIESSWELIQENDVHQIIVMIDKTENTPLVKRKIDEIFKDNNYNLQVKTWEDLSEYYQKVKSLYTSIFQFVSSVVAFVLIFAIVNTILMSVYERTREIGTLRAIGTNAEGIRSLFLSEGMYIGLIGGTLGIILSIVITIVVNNANIMMAAPPGMTVGYPLRILIIPDYIFITFILVVLISMIAAIFPARKAAKLSIVDAIRYV